MTARITVDNTAHRDHAQAAACRKLWAAVILALYNDWWTETRKAKEPEQVEAIRASALRYFRGRDGKEVCALAGIDADPERLADVAVDLAAIDRTKLLPREGLTDYDWWPA